MRLVAVNLGNQAERGSAVGWLPGAEVLLRESYAAASRSRDTRTSFQMPMTLKISVMAQKADEDRGHRPPCRKAWFHTASTLGAVADAEPDRDRSGEAEAADRKSRHEAAARHVDRPGSKHEG